MIFWTWLHCYHHPSYGTQFWVQEFYSAIKERCWEKFSRYSLTDPLTWLFAFKQTGEVEAATQLKLNSSKDDWLII